MKRRVPFEIARVYRQPAQQQVLRRQHAIVLRRVNEIVVAALIGRVQIESVAEQ